MSSRRRRILRFVPDPSRPQRRSRRLRRLLQVERLEDRRLMNADDPLAGGLASGPLSPTVATPAAGAAAAEAFGAFQSREELRAWLIQLADQQWGDLFGQTRQTWGWFDRPWLNGAAVLLRTALTAATTNDASSTNVQVAGVDEADLVETDGEYLYIISGRDLVIVKTGVGEELQIASRVRLDDDVTGMYLDGERLALVSTKGGGPYFFGGGVRVATFSLLATDVAWWGGETEPPPRPKTTVTLLDVSDRTAPAVVKTTEFDGRLVDSRTVDGQLRLVISNDFHLPEPTGRNVPREDKAPAKISTPESDVFPRLMIADDSIYGYSPWFASDYVYETRDEYIARVIDALVDGLPKVREIPLDGEVVAESDLAAAQSIYRPEGKDLGSLTTVATINMHGSGAVVDKASVIAGADATVYATQTSLYLLAQKEQNWAVTAWNAEYQGPSTNIWKFDFDAETHDVTLAARGKVDGAILNQFSVDEHAGKLRVVTSGSSAGHELQVLEQAGKQLTVIGRVGGLAPDESLYSVRFMGDVAFAVTFRRVDPLFVIDLSDPTAPEVVGELKIPGYSDYLQLVDETHLMGIGRGANEDNGMFEELQVSIFDIGDLSDPQLVDRYSFGGGRTTATAATGDRWALGDGDHHAVSYFASEQMLAVPIFTADPGTWWGEDVEPLFEHGHGGLQVFRIDSTGQLDPIALIEHDELISRAVQVGDQLYALSAGAVTVHSLEDPEAQLGELAIGADAGDAPTPLRMFAAETALARVAAEAAPVSDAANGAAAMDPAAAWLAGVDAAVRSYAPPRASKLGNIRDDAVEGVARALARSDRLAPRPTSPATSRLLRVDEAFEDADGSSDDDAAEDDALGRSAILPDIDAPFA
jgi:uncharacterized secreted protein with C-terminal beta-propeller domain